MSGQQLYNDEIDLRDYIEVIKRRWKVISFVALSLALFVLIFSYMQQPVYEAKTTVLVRTGGGGSSSRLAALTSLVGVNLSSSSGGSIGDLMALLKTKAVAAKVVENLKLKERIAGWDNPNKQDYQLAASVQGMLQKPEAKGSLLEIKVAYKDPKLSAEIADGFIPALSYYWNELNYSEAQKKRGYIEGQLPRVEKDLASIEKKIKSFSLLGVTQPSIEFKRLEREFEIQNNVYMMLRQQYESVKLEESKEIQPFVVVDQAIAPKKPSKPTTKLNTMIGLVLGLFLGGFVAFFQEYWEKTGK